jgi:predicted molibdopterin-dependent oxidoreductase YjgC
LAGKVSLIKTPSGYTSPLRSSSDGFQAILTGKPYLIRALYCHGSNIIVTYADSKLVKETLMGLDFFAVAGLFMAETAELANIVLLAST